MVVSWERLRAGLHRMSWIIFALFYLSVSALGLFFCIFAIFFNRAFILSVSLNVIGSKATPATACSPPGSAQSRQLQFRLQGDSLFGVSFQQINMRLFENHSARPHL